MLLSCKGRNPLSLLYGTLVYYNIPERHYLPVHGFFFIQSLV
ncbi:hypothetical protein BACFIN_06363 [Bacteroides finegoldii DSM 17565]|nr:hypothetical protein BACFIN_06363 [Bacteroides finegoldii DSM 17565]